MGESVSAFSIEVDKEGVAVITINLPGDEVNRLNNQSMQEIEEFLNKEDEREIIEEDDEEIQAAVIISGKKDDFISGADVGEFLKIHSSDQARTISLRTQDIISRIENFRFPFVSAINGACLGVGLEIALACVYRIATDDSKTAFALPEVQLGLIPSGGGTQRLPRLIGIKEAIDMILTGKILNHKQALKMGLVDEVVPREILLDIAKKRALQIATRELKPRRPARNLIELILEGNVIGRKALFNKERKKITSKAQNYNPASIMALEAIETGMNSSFNRGLHVESVYFSELVMSDSSRQLIETSKSIDDLKKEPVVENKEIKPKRVEKIAVVGAGILGSGVSKISAGIDVAVRLKDRDMKSAGSGLRSCYDYFEQEFRKGNITRLEMEKRLNRISATSDYTGLRRADMVIEAVPEDLELKKKILEEVESVTRDECIFASTAASLPIAQIASRAKRPENVIRMYFFHPVESALLVEVAVTGDTSPETVATALEFGKRLGKTAIVVKDKAGFYTTRILTPYFNEALILLEEGATVDGIDTVMMEFGFPVGPLMLLDEMGVEEKAKDAELLYEAFGERLKTPSSLKSLIQHGRLGRKSKRGFYNYNGKNKVDNSVYKLFPIENNEEQLSKEEVRDRLSLAMVNEAVYCLEEGVIRNPRDGDVAAVLGLGFPAYLGGPFRYIDMVGARTILKRLESLSSYLGPCFNPAPLLNDFARQGKKFYTD